MMFTKAVPLPPLIVAAVNAPALVPFPRFSVPVAFAALANVSMPPTETVPFSVRLIVPFPPTPTVRFPLFVHVPPRIFAMPSAAEGSPSTK